MNIKKIIKEEVNDFDWADEAPDIDYPTITTDTYNMYMTTNAVKYLLNKENRNIETEPKPKFIQYKNMRWVSGGMTYTLSVEIYQRGENKWGVRGMCGDSGWGYVWLTKRQTIGKRGKKQIFNQIMSEFPSDINESDFDWVDSIDAPEIYVGREFTENPDMFEGAGDTVYQIMSVDDTHFTVIGEDIGSSEELSIEDGVEMFQSGEWIPYEENIKK
jgi:hypothetical protein